MKKSHNGTREVLYIYEDDLLREIRHRQEVLILNAAEQGRIQSARSFTKDIKHDASWRDSVEMRVFAIAARRLLDKARITNIDDEEGERATLHVVAMLALRQSSIAIARRFLRNLTEWEQERARMAADLIDSPDRRWRAVAIFRHRAAKEREALVAHDQGDDNSVEAA